MLSNVRQRLRLFSVNIRRPADGRSESDWDRSMRSPADFAEQVSAVDFHQEGDKLATENGHGVTESESDGGTESEVIPELRLHLAPSLGDFVPDPEGRRRFDRDIRPGHSRWCECPDLGVRDHRAARQRMLNSGADMQLSAALFTRLPTEIRRLIFAEIWLQSGYEHGIHICFDLDARKFYHCPCVTGTEEGSSSVVSRTTRQRRGGSDRLSRGPSNGPSVEEESSPYNETNDGSEEEEPSSPHMAWTANFASVWFHHWKCDATAEEARRNKSTASLSPFLPVLLTCKRFCIEGLESIFESLTFSFQNRWVPLKFFAHHPHPSLSLIRSVHFTINHWNGSFSQWECLWASLAELENLREIRIWLNQEPKASPNSDRDMTVRDILDIIGENLAHKVVFDLPIVKDTNRFQRRYNLEDAPFEIRWHKRGVLNFGLRELML